MWAITEQDTRTSSLRDKNFRWGCQQSPNAGTEVIYSKLSHPIHIKIVFAINNSTYELCMPEIQLQHQASVRTTSVSGCKNMYTLTFLEFCPSRGTAAFKPLGGLCCSHGSQNSHHSSVSEGPIRVSEPSLTRPNTLQVKKSRLGG